MRIRSLSWFLMAALCGCSSMFGAADSASTSGPTPLPSPQPAPEDTTIDSNPFVLTEADPFATFAADVDTASYDIFRRSLLRGTLPDPGEVRVEEYVNYFRYAYPKPELDSDVPFSISLAASAHISGAPTKVLRVGIQGREMGEKPAMNLVFLVDVSGSMSAPNKLPLVQLMLAEALAVLDPSDSVSIVTYAGDTRVVLAPTEARERSKIKGVIASLGAAGGTNGGSGIQLAYEQASSHFLEAGVNHVLLCTDGDFNLGLTSDEELLALIEGERKTGITLTALGFGDRNNDAMMERVSNAGNGIYSVLYNEDQAIAYTHERLLSSMLHIAKDVKLQVELNEQHVYAYRLIGYEDRALADDDFRDDRVDAGEIGAGHQVTALFELALQEDDLPASVPRPARGASELERHVSGDELVRVSVRWKQPGARESDPASEVAATLSLDDVAEDVAQLDPDAAWAMGVASLAESLRQTPYARDVALPKLRRLLAPLAATDAARNELMRLWPEVERLQSR